MSKIKFLVKIMIITPFIQAFKIRRKPRVLQMPITSRCNSRCKTCNVWKLDRTEKTDIDAVALKKVLQDPFFSKVTAVGLNGGEFTLVKNFSDIVEAVLSLPQIKSIHLISNGLLPERLLEYLECAKALCKTKGVILNFTLSVDGYGKTHELVRGVPNSFVKTKYIMDVIAGNKGKYCDNLIIGCTLSKYNIAYIRETENFLNQYEFPIEYHLAVPNKRIYTFEDTDYYVLNDEKSRLLAAEYFYGKFLLTPKSNIHDKFRYFAMYYFLKNKGHGRLCPCGYLYQDVTIDEKLNLSLCATASDHIGNLKEKSASSMRKDGQLNKMAKINHKYCDSCIHYVYTPTLKGRLCFFRTWLSLRYSLKIYKRLS